MTIIIANRQTLAAALKHGASIVEKSGVDVVNNARLSVQRGQLALMFTDLSLWLSTSIAVEADAITVTSIPATLLSRAVDAMEGTEARIEVSANAASASISSGRAKFKLPIIPGDQFPAVPAEDLAACKPATVSVKAIGEALASVAYAAPSEICNWPQAVFFDLADGEFNLVAQDGKRLAHAAISNDGEEIPGFGLPMKAARVLARLCADVGTGDVSIAATDRLASFSVGNWLLVTNLIQAKVGRYADVVDERAGDPIMFDPRAMERALGRLSLISDQYAQGVRFELQADKLTLSLANQKSGEATEEVPVAYEGEPQTLGYSLTLMRDALRNIPGDDAEMFVSLPVKRALLTARHPANGGSTHLIGPFAV
jgi:DNA polymerase-3 subunit beta